MAQITEVRLVDDLDGGAAAESVAFGIDGKFYEIDLNEAHAARLREVFAPFVGSARRASGGPPVGARAKAPAAGRSRGDTTAIREWAIAHGHVVSGRGRIPTQVIEAYERRESAPTDAPPAAPAAAGAETSEASEVVVGDKPKRRGRKKAASEN